MLDIFSCALMDHLFIYFKMLPFHSQVAKVDGGGS